jgi:hypothetical protein
MTRTVYVPLPEPEDRSVYDHSWENDYRRYFYLLDEAGCFRSIWWEELRPMPKLEER